MNVSSERNSGFGGTIVIMALALIARAPVEVVAAPVGTAFTYQGQLKEGGVPFDGTADFQFTLWDAAGSGNPPTGGTQVGGVQAINALPVTAGLFTVSLNAAGEFGPSAFNGDVRWVQVHVNGTPLAPRQSPTPTPYALKVPGVDGHSLDAADGDPTDALFVDNAGKVGIGTSTPLGKLDVRGDGLVLAYLEGTSTLGAWLRIKSATTDGRLWGILSSSTDNGEGPGDLVFFDGTAGITRMNIDGPTGNVGIGSNTPAAKLDVRDEGQFLAHLEGTSTAGTWLSIKSAAPSGHDWGIVSTSSDNGEGPGDLVFYDWTTGQTRMDIDGPTGYVGFGTTSPDNTLHVMKGSAGAVTGYASAPLVVENSTHAYINLLTPDASERGILFGETSSNTAGGIIYNSATTSDGFQFRTNGNDTKVVISASGNVGIGDTTPNARLDVEVSSSTVAAFNRSDNGIVVSIQRAGVQEGTITNTNGNVTYTAFTGAHYAWSDAMHQPGQLVSMSGQNRQLHNRPDSEVMYGIRTTSLANDAACLGAYLGSEESTKAPAADNPLLVAAVGNGELCVVDGGNGDLDPGDDLISSDVPGCATRDDPRRFAVGHIVARAAGRVEWAKVPVDDQGVRRAKISVLFGNFTRMASVESMNARIDRLQGELENVRAERDAAIAELKERLARLESPAG